MQSQEAAGPGEGQAWLSTSVERKEPSAIIKAEAEFSEVTAGIYFVCKINKFAAEITGTWFSEPTCLIQSTFFKHF